MQNGCADDGDENGGAQEDGVPELIWSFGATLVGFAGIGKVCHEMTVAHYVVHTRGLEVGEIICSGLLPLKQRPLRGDIHLPRAVKAS